MIEIRDATKRYGATAVVDGVTLTLPDVGVTAIIGPNGAGKSTLLGMIGRLIAMNGGSVVLDGLDVTRTPGDALARRLSILRQGQHVTTRLTVRDLVAFGRYPHAKGRPNPGDEAHLDRALGFLDLAALGDRFLDELSGGQRQRAYIAMVLCQDTDYVLLDEPLNNLDLKHARAMMRLVRRLADELGKSIVLVLHDINVAAAYADRIVAMRHGRIVRDGHPDGIMTAPVLSAIYDIEIEIVDVGGRRIAIDF